MIPLFAITTCNQLESFKKLIDSINYPIETVSILVNSSLDYFDEIRKFIENNDNKNIKKFELSLCVQNMGCSSSWNFHIKHYPNAKYWVLCSDDIILGENDLGQIDHSMSNHDACFANNNSWFILFAMNKNMIKEVGLFDENIHPGNYEDEDYKKRMSIKNMTVDNGKICEFNFTGLHYNEPVGKSGGGTGKSMTQDGLNKYIDCMRLNGEYFNKKWSGVDSNKAFGYMEPNYWIFDIEERSKKEIRITFG
jgi:hypothetical protein